MRAKILKHNQKIIGYVYFFTDYKIKPYRNKKQFVRELIKSLGSTKVGYAGFQKKKDLEKTLVRYLFDYDFEKKESFKKLINFRVSKSKIQRFIKNALVKSRAYLIPKKPTRIFIFPTFSDFVKKRLGGMNGYTPWRFVFHLYIYPKIFNFKEELEKTIAHEFNHTIFDEYHEKWNGILDSIISEGLADNFRLKVLDRTPSPWSFALTKKKCQKIWPRVKKLLKSKSPRLYHALFFGDKKYPLWTGYSLGYQIVKSFLKKHSKIRWEEIIKFSSKEILKKSGWN